MAIRHLFMLFTLFCVSTAFAITPSKEQIEQFKKLPKSQQVLLAKQYGIDLGSISSSDNNTQATKQQGELGSSINKNQKTQSEENYFSDEEKRFKPKVDKVQPFGYDIFSQQTSSFNQAEVSLVPDDYLLGIGDKLKITLFGQQSSEQIVEVDSSGRIAIPELQPIDVIGLTFADLVGLLKEKVSRELIGTSIYVSIAELKSINVLVLGEVSTPGSYSLNSLSTITHSLYKSGGLTDIASLRNIQLRRKGKLIQTLDLYELLLQGNTVGNIELKSGDTVFVPSITNRVKVVGAVRRPAYFEFKENETVSDVLDMAGGVKASAYKDEVKIVRYSNEARKLISISPTELANFRLHDGDEISVQESSNEFRNEVTLIGAVVRPGKYSLSKTPDLLSLIGNPRTSLLPQADKHYGLILRGGAFSDISIIQFSFTELLESNIPLKAGDEVFVFSRYEYKDEEDKMLASLDLTEKELELQNRSKLWHLYEQQLFEAFVNVDALGQLNGEEESKAFIAEENMKWLSQIGGVRELNDKVLSPFSRANLLQAILKKLNYQASPNKPVKIITVKGKVRYPGNYPIGDNFTVADAVNAAGGLVESAYMAQAELTSYKRGAELDVEHASFNLQTELNAPTIYLSSKDTLNILATPKWSEENQVSLRGEVKFPGLYTIARGESLISVIERAGGFTEFAAINGAVFTRDEIKKQEQLQIKKLTESLQREIATKSLRPGGNDVAYSEVKQLLADLSKVEAKGRLVIDLPKILNGEQNLILQDGDALIIPPQRDSISVIGEVNYPSSHLYEGTLDLSQYVSKSGGFKEFADEDRLYIIKANGSVVIPKSSWFAVERNNLLEPGDTIVVPLDSTSLDTLTLWSTSTQIIYQIGVAMAAISSI
ncbi:polysaccharide biosynthesis protein [Pseudoalteromonas lipolytica SCSIO 04301]|uniref:SLBB domain-containing protein n=1 Tax=Pseudoalteromonas lipolytica TaxID=570156 RepID=UPI0004517881|nr:SLBB domain-containing protein [Pseudoalteromonas lipolytica]EWH04613.1 polysaccharide biosynthesis protein [Pseudoalteromonas lipolytica SCSIO 04301]